MMLRGSVERKVPYRSVYAVLHHTQHSAISKLYLVIVLRVPTRLRLLCLTSHHKLLSSRQESRYLCRQTVWCHESMILHNLTCNFLWPAILWLFGVWLWNLYHLLIALISKHIQNCMVLYRTVFDILTPKVGLVDFHAERAAKCK